MFLKKAFALDFFLEKKT